MASRGASNLHTSTTEFADEVTLQILSYWSIKDVKEARRTSHSLARLGAQFVFKTLYVSPRTKDMEVFTAITNHPLLRDSIRHVFFDSAYFVERSVEEYVEHLHHQLAFDIDQCVPDPYTQADSDSDFDSDFRLKYVNPTHHFGSRPDYFVHYTSGEASDISRLLLGLKLLTEDQCHFEPNVQHSLPPFIHEGYELYTRMVEEQSGAHTYINGWFDRVCKGLKFLGPVDCVSVRNSWSLFKV
ncbi:MAG: hypothetical protein Q9213_005457 [Squamulea squamosa]